MPAHLREAFRDLSDGLLASGAEASEPLHLYGSGAAAKAKAELLQFLDTLGFVTCIHRGSHASAWKITPLGKQSMRTLTTLKPNNYCLQVSEKNPYAKLSTFGLLHLAEYFGWKCFEKLNREQVLPYSVGHDKNMYVRSNAKSFNHFYLWALLEADTLKVPIKHFQPPAYYKALLNGKEYSIRDSLSVSCFRFASRRGQAIAQRPGPRDQRQCVKGSERYRNVIGHQKVIGQLSRGHRNVSGMPSGSH